MTTGLTVYENVKEPMAFVEKFGGMIARSRMFGCQNEAQGQVLAMACLAERQNPIAIKRMYHIIDGNLSMRSDAMLAELRNRGGKHKVLKRTPDEASIEVSFNGEKLTESLSWEEAQKEPWPFGKGGQLKKNWATPRARRQMLWARVVSEAVRTIAPEIIAGVYTPEESEDFSEAGPNGSAPVNVDQLMAETAAKANGQDEVVDAEYEVKHDIQQDAPEAESVSSDADDQDGGSTTDQRNRLRQLFNAVGASSEQIEKALAKRGCKSFRNLSCDQAAELIATLEAKVAAASEQLAGESRLPDDAHSSDVTGPVAQATVDQIKSLLSSEFELAKKVKEHLAANSKQKLAELSQADADALLDAIKTQSIETFFARSLEKPPF